MKLSTVKLAPPQQSNPSTRPVGPTETTASPVPATDLGSESAATHDGRNPLWIITAGLGIFFAVAAAFLAAG
jgi:hypothetical protein